MSVTWRSEQSKMPSENIGKNMDAALIICQKTLDPPNQKHILPQYFYSFLPDNLGSFIERG